MPRQPSRERVLTDDGRRRRSSENRAPNRKARADDAKSKVFGISGLPVIAAASRRSSSSAAVANQSFLELDTLPVKRTSSSSSNRSVATAGEDTLSAAKARGRLAWRQTRFRQQGNGTAPGPVRATVQTWGASSRETGAPCCSHPLLTTYSFLWAYFSLRPRRRPRTPGGSREPMPS